VELFCLEWSLEGALILSMASLRGGGGVEFQHLGAVGSLTWQMFWGV
jgi:hypothetical protein